MLTIKFLSSKGGSIGSKPACGPKDPSSNPARGNLVIYDNLVIIAAYICIPIGTIQLLIFTEKLSPLPGFEPGDLPGTKLICCQLSYPGLENTS